MKTKLQGMLGGSLEIITPIRGRKRYMDCSTALCLSGLEIITPIRGRKRKREKIDKWWQGRSLEIITPIRGRKPGRKVR